MTNRVKVINAIKFVATYFHHSDGLPDYRLDSADFGDAADKILSELQLKDEQQPQLSKPDCYTPLLDIQPKAGCPVCGGTMVFIRGKYPGADKREVCPTCAWERLEQINDISQPNYGMAYKSNGV